MFSRCVVALVGLNVLWRLVRFLTGRPLWGDEAMLAISFFGRGYRQLLEPLAWSQLAPPGFLWISKTQIDLFGPDPWVMRLWPVIAGTAAMLLFVMLARASLRLPEALLAIAIMAASYYPLRHSVEFKPYSTDLLAAVTILWLAIRIERRIRREAPAVGAWVALAAAGCVAVWLSFPSVFVSGAAALWLALLALQRNGASAWSRLLPPLLTGALLVASFLAMYLLYYDVVAEEMPQYRQMRMWARAFPPTDRPWLIPWWLLDVHAGTMLAYPHGGKNFGSTLTLGLVIAGAWSLWKAGGHRRRLLGLVLLVLAMGLIAAFLGMYPYGSTVRTMLYAAPGLLLLAGAGAWFLLKRLFSRRSGERGARIFAGLMAALIVGGAASDLINPAKAPEEVAARDTVLGLANSRMPGEIWIMPYTSPLPGNPKDASINSPTGAVSHYYALRNLGGELLHRPEPGGLEAILAADKPPRVRVIVSRTGELEVKATIAAAPYVRILDNIYGAGLRQLIVLGPGDELIVWTWPEAAGSTTNERPSESRP